jgi:membrane-bound serine protease (ClpP class)
MDYLTIALVLLALGVAMLLAEVFVPTGGILVVVAVLFFALAVGVILYYGTTIEAVVAVGGLAVGIPASGYVAVSAWRRFSLSPVLDDDLRAATVVTNEYDELKGRTGKTVSPLRPSGSVEFDGKRVDAMTEGVMLDAGVWVRCVEVKGGKVVVRAIETLPDVSAINPDSRPIAVSEPKAPVAKNEEPQKDEKKDEAKRPRDDFDDFDIGLDKI